MYIEKLKEMFDEMVIKKAPDRIPEFYHTAFIIYTNGREMDYETFLNSHLEYYSTPIQYEVVYDTETFLEEGEKIAGRVWITTTRPDEPPTKIEVMLVAQYKENKLYRLWELTYPDWSQLPAFKDKI